MKVGKVIKMKTNDIAFRAGSSLQRKIKLITFKWIPHLFVVHMTMH